MKNLFKKQSAKFVQNPSRFTKVMAKHILVCFFMPHSVEVCVAVVQCVRIFILNCAAACTSYVISYFLCTARLQHS